MFYEVGTEEIAGGMTDPQSLKFFIELLEDELKDLKYDIFKDNLVFVVGQVGTTMNLDMENKFDVHQAKKLTDIASNFDLFLKVHYTDWLPDSTIKEFPNLGIGAANLGPEFATASISALSELEQEEKKALSRQGKENEQSKFFKSLKSAAFEGAPWTKFAPDQLQGEELEKYGRENKEKIALSVGRYVLNEPSVKEARKKLYKNLSKYANLVNVEQSLVEKIRTSIHRYIKAFNLSSLQNR